MKRLKLSGVAAIVCLLMSCSNQASDSNTTTETSTRTETEKVESTPPQEYSAPSSNADADDAVKSEKTDTAKTSISIGKDGASVKTKKGDGVSYGKEGVKVDRKDVKIDIKRDTN